MTPRTVVTWRRALLVIGALALVSGLAVVDAMPVGVVRDDAMYVILARSLASGQGYRYLNLPGAPVATHFPPGYPALLAVVSWLVPAFPASVIFFKALNALFLAAAAMLTAHLARRVVGTAWAFAVGAMSAVSVPLLLLGNLVLSELFFLAILLALLSALEAVVERQASARRVALLGALIGACALVRTHGVVLLPAAALVLCARRRWRDAALLAGAAVLVLLPWQLWSARHAAGLPAPLLGNYGSYVGWWLSGLRAMGPAMLPATLARTVAEGTTMLSTLFSPMRGAAAHAVTLVLLILLALAGAERCRQRLPVTLLFLAGYLAVVAVWRFPPSRFIWGVWPLLLLLVVAGADASLTFAAALPRPPFARVLPALACAWLVAGYGAYELRAARGAWWGSIARTNAERLSPAVRWTLRSTAPTDVVAAEDEGAIYLYTGRRAVPVFSFTAAQYLREHSPVENAAEGLVPILSAYPARVVLVGTGASVAAAQSLTATQAPRLALREELSRGVVFTVLPQ